MKLLDRILRPRYLVQWWAFTDQYSLTGEGKAFGSPLPAWMLKLKCLRLMEKLSEKYPYVRAKINSIESDLPLLWAAHVGYIDDVSMDEKFDALIKATESVPDINTPKYYASKLVRYALAWAVGPVKCPRCGEETTVLEVCGEHNRRTYALKCVSCSFSFSAFSIDNRPWQQY